MGVPGQGSVRTKQFAQLLTLGPSGANVWHLLSFQVEFKILPFCSRPRRSFSIARVLGLRTPYFAVALLVDPWSQQFLTLVCTLGFGLQGLSLVLQPIPKLQPSKTTTLATV